MKQPVNFRLALFICIIAALLQIQIFAQSLETVVQTGHSLPIQETRFSPDGRFLITRSASLSDVQEIEDISSDVQSGELANLISGTVKLWDVRTGREIRTIGESAVYFSPN
ncbi:MAG: hypothetical protein KDK34_14545, partial [Leptospiraceae bacterium]|nr:hypothetical protein [Leptospiraceae bacterium]